MNEAPDERKDGPKPRRRANSLDGRTWTRHSISVWSDLRKTPAEAALKHPAMFPTALPARLIECFTPAGAGLVLDPFAGTGSTLAAALLAGKSAIGFELSPRYAELARERCVDAIRESGNGVRFDIQSRDALTLGECLAPASVDLCVTSPPYWDILLRRRTADGKDQRDYGDAAGDLGKIESYEAFLGALEAIFGKVLGVLKPGAYLCAVVMDIRKRSVFYPFHSDLAARLQRSGFIYDDLIIWDRRQEYNNLRPLGYPSVFRINKAHEFIIIAQKPKEAAVSGASRAAGRSTGKRG